MVEAAREFVCDTCTESVGRKHQRPAKLHEARDFNDLVGLDGFYWSGSRDFRIHVFHCIDEASLFHLGRPYETRNPDQVIDTWTNFWNSWVGNPVQLYTDPAGEFISFEWKDMLRNRATQPLVTPEAWQRGRAERHGQILKRMLLRCDLERPIENEQDFDCVLLACFQAKNTLIRQYGYSPEQIMLGKSLRLPGSLTSDNNALSHTLALSDEPESESFRRLLEIRTIARMSFLMTDNDQLIRRALLRRSCPSRGPFEPGQLVMYWLKRHRTSRQEAGRWHGPAKVVLQESQSAVWITHADRLFKCSPESLRPASLREWNTMYGHNSSWIPEIAPFDPETKNPNTPVPSEPYEPSIVPDIPNQIIRSQSVTPNSSVQPESELFRDPSNQLPINEVAEPVEDSPQNEEPLDLDATDEPNDGPTENAMPILHCSALESSVYEWTQFDPGEATQDILLADNGLPMIENPFECEE